MSKSSSISESTSTTVSNAEHTATSQKSNAEVKQEEAVHHKNYLQPKMKIGAVDDSFEREADKVADVVVGSSEVTTLPTISSVSSTSIQNKCNTCDDELIQQKTSGSGTSTALSSVQKGISETKGGGKPLSIETQQFMGGRIGHDFSQVKIHTGSKAEGLNKSLNARAFTSGNDIYFNKGQYQPNTKSGKHLLAHELTHTVQQRAIGVSIQTKKVNTGGVIQRDPLPMKGECPVGVVDDSKLRSVDVSEDSNQSFGESKQDLDESDLTCVSVLDRAIVEANFNKVGITLDEEDIAIISSRFPIGFRLESTEITVGVYGENFLEGVKVKGYKVLSTTTPTGVINTIIFQLGKGRSILITNTGEAGRSIILDAGAGGSTNSNGRAQVKLRADYQNVFRSRLADNPIFLTVSHLDVDHINAIKKIFELPNFNETDIRVSRQQITGALGAREWNRMEIQLQPGRSVLQLNVAGGGGVHTSLEIVGNIELREFRLVEAHDRLMNPGRSRYDKNSTSEVAVVRDLINHSTRVFSADIDGRTLERLIDSVGVDAFRRILGGGGRNLELAELPHHGGRVSSSQVRGMLLFYRLSFEASKGDLTFFTQTSPNFAGKDSASINVLESLNAPVIRVTSGSEISGQSEVTQHRQSKMETIIIRNGVREAVNEMVISRSDSFSRAYAYRHEILTLEENLTELAGVFEGAKGTFPELARSVELMKTELGRQKAELSIELNNVWRTLEIAGSSEGLRMTTNLEGVREAVVRLNGKLGELRLDSIKGGMEMHLKGISAYHRFFTNLGQMIEALKAGDSSRIRGLKAKQTKLFAEAQATISITSVNTHAAEAWQKVRRVWTPRLIRSVSKRASFAAVEARMLSDFVDNIRLLEHVAGIKEFHRQVRSGHVSPVGKAPVRTRVGAGILVAIEALRIGLELGEAWHGSVEANIAQGHANRAEGLREVLWWKSFGVTPEMHLVNSRFVTGFLGEKDALGGLTQEKIEAVLEEKEGEETVEYQKVVVAGLTNEELVKVTDILIISVNTMTDWIEEIESVAGGPWFKKFDSGWGVRYWNESEGRYSYYIRSVLQEPLNFLFDAVQFNQEGIIDRDVETKGKAKMTVRDSAWVFGQDRLVYVYNSYGREEEIDFDSENPQLIPIQQTTLYKRIGRSYVGVDVYLAKAADLETYNTLSKYYWIEKGEVTFTGTETLRVRNTAGLCYVKVDDFVNNPVVVPVMDEPIVVPFEKNMPKLKIGSSSDPLEKEADHVADHVIGNKKVPKISSVGNAVQSKGAREGSTSNGFDTGLKKSRGNPMDKQTNQFMSSRFGRSFDDVRIHDNAQASQLNNQIGAKAFATGNDIYFNKGEYQPQSKEGKRLLAHELTHTVQQGQGGKKVQREPLESNPGSVKIYGILRSTSGDSVTLFASANFQSSSDNFEMDNGTRVEVFDREGEFYWVQAFGSVEGFGYAHSGDLTPALINQDGEMDVFQSNRSISRDDFEEQNPELAVKIQDLYWEYMALLDFAETVRIPSGFPSPKYTQLWYSFTGSNRWERSKRWAVEQKVQYSSIDLLRWVSAVESTVIDFLPILSIESSNVDGDRVRSAELDETIEGWIRPLISNILEDSFFDLGRRELEARKSRRSMERLQVAQRTDVDRAIIAAVQFLRRNPIRADNSPELTHLGMKIAKLLATEEIIVIDEKRVRGFNLSSIEILEVLSGLSQIDPALAEQAMYRGETISWLLEEEGMSGFGSFRADGEGMFAGMERGYRETMATTTAPPFAGWGITDNITFSIAYNLNVPKGFLLGAWDTLVGLYSLFTPSFWNEMYRIATDEAHRFEIGVALGTAMANEFRTYQAMDAWTVGARLGTLVGRIFFEVVLTLLTAGSFQLTKINWAGRFPVLAGIAKTAASSRAGTLAIGAVKVIIKGLDIISDRLREVQRRLSRLTAYGRMNDELARLELEALGLIDNVGDAKAIANAGRTEEATQLTSAIETSVAALERQVDEATVLVIGPDPNGSGRVFYGVPESSVPTSRVTPDAPKLTTSLDHNPRLGTSISDTPLLSTNPFDDMPTHSLAPDSSTNHLPPTYDRANVSDLGSGSRRPTSNESASSSSSRTLTDLEQHPRVVEASRTPEVDSLFDFETRNEMIVSGSTHRATEFIPEVPRLPTSPTTGTVSGTLELPNTPFAAAVVTPTIATQIATVPIDIARYRAMRYDTLQEIATPGSRAEAVLIQRYQTTASIDKLIELAPTDPRARAVLRDRYRSWNLSDLRRRALTDPEAQSLLDTYMTMDESVLLLEADAGGQLAGSVHRERFGPAVRRVSGGPFMKRMLAIISNPNHPLHHLGETVNGVFQWRTITFESRRGEIITGRFGHVGGETGPVMQAGHVRGLAGSRPGEAQVFMLEFADDNYLTGMIIEAKGGVSLKQYVVVEGVPIDVKGLKFLEQAAPDAPNGRYWVPPGTLDRAVTEELSVLSTKISRLPDGPDKTWFSERLVELQVLSPEEAVGGMRLLDADIGTFVPISIQPKLKVGSSSDPLEKEADDMADMVMAEEREESSNWLSVFHQQEEQYTEIEPLPVKSFIETREDQSSSFSKNPVGKFLAGN